MKLIIAVLLLAIGTFAQNTKYKDGTDCECDSIVTTYTASEANAVYGFSDITEDAEREIPFKNGKINGIAKRYYESGALEGEHPHINGKENGIAKVYYESGALEGEHPYINDKMNGVVKIYYENGKLAGTSTYKNNKLIGYVKCTDGRFGNENLIV